MKTMIDRMLDYSLSPKPVLANYGPQAISSLLPGFVNKVLME